MVDKIEDGGSGFPSKEQYDASGMQLLKGAESGMSLRDYFAAKMMPSQLARELYPYKDYNYDNAAIRSYSMADAMIRVRKSK